MRQFMRVKLVKKLMARLMLIRLGEFTFLNDHLKSLKNEALLLKCYP